MYVRQCPNYLTDITEICAVRYHTCLHHLNHLTTLLFCQSYCKWKICHHLLSIMLPQTHRTYVHLWTTNDELTFDDFSPSRQTSESSEKGRKRNRYESSDWINIHEHWSMDIKHIKYGKRKLKCAYLMKQALSGLYCIWSCKAIVFLQKTRIKLFYSYGILLQYLYRLSMEGQNSHRFH